MNGPQNEVMSIEIVRPFASHTFNLGIPQSRLDGGYDAQCDFILKCEDVLELTIVTFGQQVDAGFRLDQLRADADTLAGIAKASFEHISRAKFAADTFYVNSLSLIGEGRIARDHRQPLDPRKSGDDVLDDTIGEIVLSRIAAQIFKWQDSDRRLVRRCARDGPGIDLAAG